MHNLLLQWILYFLTILSCCFLPGMTGPEFQACSNKGCLVIVFPLYECLLFIVLCHEKLTASGSVRVVGQLLLLFVFLARVGTGLWARYSWLPSHYLYRLVFNFTDNLTVKNFYCVYTLVRGANLCKWRKGENKEKMIRKGQSQRIKWIKDPKWKVNELKVNTNLCLQNSLSWFFFLSFSPQLSPPLIIWLTHIFIKLLLTQTHVSYTKIACIKATVSKSTGGKALCKHLGAKAARKTPVKRT